MLPGKRFNLEVGGQSALAYLPTYHNMTNIIITIKKSLSPSQSSSTLSSAPSS
jgi:hypothetical protein